MARRLVFYYGSMPLSIALSCLFNCSFCIFPTIRKGIRRRGVVEGKFLSCGIFSVLFVVNEFLLPCIDPCTTKILYCLILPFATFFSFYGQPHQWLAHYPRPVLPIVDYTGMLNRSSLIFSVFLSSGLGKESLFKAESMGKETLYPSAKLVSRLWFCYKKIGERGANFWNLVWL